MAGVVAYEYMLLHSINPEYDHDKEKAAHDIRAGMPWWATAVLLAALVPLAAMIDEGGAPANATRALGAEAEEKAEEEPLIFAQGRS